MCMKNVNAIISTYGEVSNQDTIFSLSRPFDMIVPSIENEKICTPEFCLYTEIQLLGTNQEKDKKENLINTKTNVRVLIRATKKASGVEENFISSILDSFVITVTDSSISHDACIEYITSKKLTKVDLATAFGNDFEYGVYVIKVLLQPQNAQDKNIWNLQALTTVRVLPPQ